MSADKPRRTWPQRLTLFVAVVGAVACFAAAGALAAGQWVVSHRQLVTLDDPTTDHDPNATQVDVVVPGQTTEVAAPAPSTAPGETTTTTTIPLAEPDAANFLVTGADNGDCVDSSSATVGDRVALGERSDTIMIWRVNPATDQLAVLSLPRDLYVDIAGGRKARINSAYRRDDPSKLIDTINLNFGIPIDHYVQVDFCAFKRLVDAVGGVSVPFDHPARDTSSGLLIADTGCVELDGNTSLAYVRSRHYQYEDPPGSDNWRSDGTSDFGRIARQQDFLRRVVAKVIDEGLYSPSVATAIIETNREYLVTDSELSVRTMLEFANALRSIDPAAITTYRIESRTDTSSGQSLEIPRIDGDNMQAILRVFRGEATLADAPDQVFATTTTIATTDTGSSTVADRSDQSSGAEGATTTLPTVEAEENPLGISPDRTISCT
jgi:LCP family protein required for cell wall assembly